MKDSGTSDKEEQSPEALWEQRKSTVVKTIFLCNAPSGRLSKRRWDENLARALNDRALQALLKGAAVRKELGREDAQRSSQPNSNTPSN